MPSRMERYDNIDVKETGRVRKNEQLYQNIYQDGEYSNIEGIASISKNNEIDLNHLKEMLRKKEEPEEKKYRTTQIPIIPKEIEPDYTDKHYDINALLHKAKEEANDDNKHRSLKEVDMDFLKSLHLKDLKSLKDNPDKADELKELIQTITSTSVLNQLGDKELSLEMLSELKPTEKTSALTDSQTLKDIIREELSKTGTSKETSMDQTFFTTNHNFKAEDFESLEEMKTSIKKNNKMIKILVYFLIAIVVIVVGYFIIKLWK